MRFSLLFLLMLGCPLFALADHITGGEVFYTFLGRQNGQYNYRVTAKMFMRCNSGRQFNNPTVISVFDKGNNARILDREVSLARTEKLQLGNPNKCITDPPLVCYDVGYYELDISLPGSINGYVVASQFVYRIQGIKNLTPFYNSIGATYTAEIPPTSDAENNSARFVGNDLVAICANNNFTYSFGAADPDGDQLQYSFCEAYQGGSFRSGAPSPPTEPPYLSVPYNSNFSGGAPLGSNVKIDPQTGFISGIAPNEGIYVVTVCVQEVRSGKVIATQRKDLQIFIAGCTIASASLLPQYNLCTDTKTLSIANLSSSPLIRSYNWEVLNRSGEVIGQSTQQGITYDFADTGTYRIKLVVNRGGECADSNISLVKVYPGQVSDFRVEGLCAGKPTRFFSSSSTVYGTITDWYWNFGDPTDNQAPVSVENPVIQYQSNGNRTVQLMVTTSLGCTDTVEKMVAIVDRPPLDLAFKDTTICINDRLQLVARSSGNYRWTPTLGTTGATSPTPTVAPQVTTWYVAELDDNGCFNRDSVLVRVENGVRLQVMADTTICAGDTIRLRTASNALSYSWTNTQGMLQPQAPNPMVNPGAPTSFQVTGRIGGCSATANIRVNAIAYPKVNAGADTIICFNTVATLRATTDGNRFTWSPAQTLGTPGSLTTTASPQATASYILTAYGNNGCPKPGYDTVTVQVTDPVRASAGRDTAVLVGQPLQLNATGGTIYQWVPATNLSDTDIANPVATFSESYTGNIRYLVRVTTAEGCVDTASVLVRIFATGPSVFVPTGFTPNGDGRNDLLRPIAAGMRQVELFAVYNRWGQLLFSSRNGNGWDGRVNGQPQQTGVYVWLVQATDYLGRPYVSKGTATLLR